MRQNFPCIIDENLLESFTKIEIVEILQAGGNAFTLIIFSGIIFTSLGGLNKTTVLEMTRWSILYYGLLWSFLWTDKEVILVLLSLSCINLSLISYIFLWQFKKAKNLHGFFLSPQKLINHSFNFEQYQKSKVLFKKPVMERLKNKDINLIWEVPYICLVILNIELVCGIYFQYVQKVFWFRLTFLLIFFSCWNYFLLFICNAVLLVLLIYRGKKYYIEEKSIFKKYIKWIG